MDPLAYVRRSIDHFPGYLDETDRRLSDELVRAYLGERLAQLKDRLSPLDTVLESRFDDLLMRTGFTNQQAFKAFEYAKLDGVAVNGVATADATAIDTADRAASIDATAVAGYLDDVGHALDARNAAQTAASKATGAA
jgi:hypothetical protein